MLSNFGMYNRYGKGQHLPVSTRAYERNIDNIPPPELTQAANKNTLKNRLRAKLATKKKEEGSS